MKPILEIHNISKKYRISHHAGGYLSLRERLVNILSFDKNTVEDFWALKDVSFEVQSGECIGIIGRNGAGKSTLLKVLSKITPPTTGKIVSRGRIASLLEVGTGFHPELTGKENIFFNGSLLGMKRKEIEFKFDEIVEFSGVEKFLDTPLKHFSSGMQLRLAFAVAAFLEPEVLIIDEVLAVGDAEFQRKCLGKMENVSKSGRTILFVSHNMSVMAQMCNRLLLLESGKIKNQGNTQQIINEYLFGLKEVTNKTGRIKLSEEVTITQFELSSNKIDHLDSLTYKLSIESNQINKISELALLVYNDQNERVGVIDLRSEQLWKASGESVTIKIEGVIKDINLVEGFYSLGLFIRSNLCRGNFYDLSHFEIAPGESEIIPYPIEHRGYVDLKHQFINNA